MSHNLYPSPCHKLSHFLRPPPPWSVTYFMDGPQGSKKKLPYFDSWPWTSRSNSLLFDLSYLWLLPSPSLNTVEWIVIHNCPCEHSSKLQLSIRFTPSRCLGVRQDWYPMYYPEGMKARVSPVQSIEPHRILAPTRDLNREPLGPQSRVVTTILPLHTRGGE